MYASSEDGIRVIEENRLLQINDKLLLNTILRIVRHNNSSTIQTLTAHQFVSTNA